MSTPTPPAKVRWSLELDPGSRIVRAVCIDTLTDERHSLELHTHTIPGLAAVLNELLERYADSFPDVLVSGLTVDGESSL